MVLSYMELRADPVWRILPDVPEPKDFALVKIAERAHGGFHDPTIELVN